MSEIGKRIKSRREELKLTQKDLAKKLGYKSKTTITKIENGTNDIAQSKVAKFAEALDTTPAYIMGLSGEVNPLYSHTKNSTPISLSFKKFPLLGEIACGNPIYANEDRENFILACSDIRADFCLKAKGDSMINARILDGDIVFIRKQDKVENGEIAAVLINDEATLKRVYYYPDEGKISLNSENPNYSPLIYIGEKLDNIHILGKAIAFQSNIK